jgi:hypothetical protein
MFGHFVLQKMMGRPVSWSGRELHPYSAFMGAFEMVQFLPAEFIKDKVKLNFKVVR